MSLVCSVLLVDLCICYDNLCGVFHNDNLIRVELYAAGQLVSAPPSLFNDVIIYCVVPPLLCEVKLVR